MPLRPLKAHPLKAPSGSEGLVDKSHRRHSKVSMRLFSRSLSLRRLLPLLTIAAGIISIFGLIRQGHNEGVCIVGNAENPAKVFTVYESWGEQFPATYFIWGDDPNLVPNPYPKRVSFVHRPKENVPFADGMFLAIRAIMSQHRCRYIFTHDDDLKFFITPNLMNEQERSAASNPKESAILLAQRLVGILEAYRPAIASFPWAVGDERFDGMIKLKEKWIDEPVAPLTGFDNGMVVYHKSVLDFFLPFPPSGEGGIYGKWTLGAHFLQLFGPSTFKEHSMRINVISYNNTINLDNIPIKKGDVTIVNGTATVPWSRHPYEYPMNEAYIAFLESGLIDRSMPYGRTLGVKDVIAPLPFYESSYTPEWVAKRVASFYNVRHEALINNQMIHQVEPALLDQMAPTNITFKVHFFTCNRLESFKRAWSSFENAEAPSRASVVAEVHVDKCKGLDANKLQEYDSYLSSLSHPFAPTVVYRSQVPLGLKQNILKSWVPTSNFEYGIFIEDDIELSPYFLQYAEQMIEAYAIRDRADYRLFGISLYNLRYNEAVEDFVGFPKEAHPIIYQQPQSWGAVYFPEPWRRFLAYQAQYTKEGKDPLVPNSMTNRWPQAASWKKTFIRFTVEKGGYFVYPNLCGGLSYSTNHAEVGTNDKAATSKAKELIQRKYTVPLLLDANVLQNPDQHLATPPLSSLKVFSLTHKVVDSIDALPHGPGLVKGFDKCTLLLNVYDRVHTYMERVRHYHGMKDLDRILILWNHETFEPEKLEYKGWNVPVQVIRTKVNSLNSRFYPWPQIKTDCVIQMDDDWDMPHEHLKYAMALWKGHHFDNLVGFSHLARNHVQVNVDGVQKTLYSPTYFSPQTLTATKKKAWASIVLTSGLVHHRKYMEEYTHGVPQAARDVVDAHNNGEDLLMNFIVANATGRGPVFVDVWAHGVQDLLFTGLFSKSKHMKDRSDAIEELIKVFHKNPLRYTTTFFKPQTATVPPGQHHHFFQEDMPFQYACNRTVYDLNGACDLVLAADQWGKGEWTK